MGRGLTEKWARPCATIIRTSREVLTMSDVKRTTSEVSQRCATNPTSDEVCGVCHRAGCECGESCQCQPLECECGPNCQCSRRSHATRDNFCDANCECWRCQLSRQRVVLPEHLNTEPPLDEHEHLPDPVHRNPQNQIDHDMAGKHNRDQQEKMLAKKARDSYVRYVPCISISLSSPFPLSFFYIYI